METIKEHETRFWGKYEIPAKEGKCGIECPKCHKELYMDYSVMLLSNPPQSKVYCKKCGYVGSVH